MTPIAPRIVHDVSNVTKLSMRVFLRGRRSIWWGWRVRLVAPRNVNDISCKILQYTVALCSTE